MAGIFEDAFWFFCGLVCGILLCYLVGLDAPINDVCGNTETVIEMETIEELEDEMSRMR